MGRVVGVGGRGVVVATRDPEQALRDLTWLRSGGLDAALMADQGLVGLSGRFSGQERMDLAFFREHGEVAIQARWWAEALRRPVVLSSGDRRWVAGPDGSGGIATDLPWVAGHLETPARPRVAVFGGAWVGEDEPEYEEARRFASLCAEGRIDVITGGYGGVMAAASQGAASHGGAAVGVTITGFSERVGVNQWLTHEIQAADLFARLPVICDAEAWVAFPGGVGTLAEIALCWNLIQTMSVPARPLVIVGERWDRALRTFRELLIAEAVHFDLVRPARDADEACELAVEAIATSA